MDDKDFEIQNLKSVMIAAAEEIAAHWDAHCNEEGYGPVNLMRRLEKGIPSEYGYKAGDFARLLKRVQDLEQMNKSYGQVMDNEDTICKTHPDAPHGFSRNASLSEGRYVCDCEYWEPPDDDIDMSEERVHISDKHEHNELKNALELQPLVKEFFNKYLNYVEESDSGRLFNPITIGCCRAMMSKPLDDLLEKMRVLSGANPNPLYEDEDNGR